MKNITRFNHDKASINDKIAIIGELEHIRRHSIRSMLSVDNRSRAVFVLISIQAQRIRRDFMQKEFSYISNDWWCLCKASACLRQLAYEIFDNNLELLKEVDKLVDSIWSASTNKDLSGCEACKEDKEKNKKVGRTSNE